MTRRTGRKPRPPLDSERLEELALAYVGRFATTRAKLERYLRGKLRERGWDGSGEPPVETIVERCIRSGFVDDAAYALAKSRAMASRGYGPRRVRQSLAAAGVKGSESGAALDHADAEAVEAAIRFARRKRIGPFAETRLEPPMRDKAIAAMLRAGHRFPLARAIVEIPPGGDYDIRDLAEKR